MGGLYLKGKNLSEGNSSISRLKGNGDFHGHITVNCFCSLWKRGLL